MPAIFKGKNGLLKGLMFVIPLAIGVAVFLFMSKSKQAPQKKEVVSDLPTVRVMEIAPMKVVPRALGYGISRPVKTWKAVAQVNGIIIHTHPQLQKGSIIRQGDELLKIDPAEYMINRTKIKATIQNFEVQIEQLKMEEENSRKLLDLQETDLAIRREEVDRQNELYQKNIISKKEYESQLQAFISQEVQVQNIKNMLSLVPVKQELLMTQLSQARADLANADRQLSHTTITAPFDIQIVEVSNKLSEFVQTGKTILEANDISETEVEAQFVMKAMRPVLLSVTEKARQVDAALAIGEALGIKATVRLASGPNGSVEWPASFNRRSDALDRETRTIGLIVVVKNDIDGIGRRGERLLFTGAYCEVELRGKTQKNQIVIPRTALHPPDLVYLVDSEHRLVKRQIEILYTLSDFLVVKSGIESGDRLILSDVIPAVNGMKLETVTDKKSFKKLQTDAGGESL